VAQRHCFLILLHSSQQLGKAAVEEGEAEKGRLGSKWYQLGVANAEDKGG